MAGLLSARATLTAELQGFLAETARRPFVYGQTDCTLVVADWWQRVHGVDPAAAYRGAYRDEAGCAALLAREGHLPRLIARLARRVGARRTDHPQPGDVAVLRVGGRWYGAIRTPSGRWWIKAHDGSAVMRNAHIVAAWSL